MSHEMLAPLAGKILSVSIEANAKVGEDDDAFVIEAMKMENPIYIPCSGTVTEVKVKEGDSVEEDDILAIIEE